MSPTTSGIGANAASSNDSSSNSSGGSNTGAIAGAVIGVVALLAIAAFFGLRYRKKKARAAEDAAIFQYGNQPGGGGASVGKGAGAGYNQQIDSNEDLHNGNDGFGYQGEKEYNGYGENEKPVGPGMAGYGTLGLTAAAAHQQQQQQQQHHQQVHPNSFMSSPSHQSMQATAFMNDYPPTPQQGYPQSARGSYGSNAPYQDGGYPMQQQQQLQPQMFVNTNVPPMQQDSRSLTSPLGMASGVPLPLSPAGTAQTNRNSMNSVAAAAAAAALGGAGVTAVNAQQALQQQQEGPFSDPAYEGKVFIVTRIFEPSMPDELVIYPGDHIQIVMSYDDGWCLGCNLDSSKRDGKPPARGVFPRDCVEEMTAEDQPISSGTGDLQRAPTLPPLDMGNSARFSMSSASGPAAQQDKRLSKRLSRAAVQPNDSEADDEMEDVYGGVASSATPTRTAFPPEIQIQQHEAVPEPRRLSQSFGSSQNVADYAVGVDQQKRLSVLQEGDEEASQLLDEFPSTPRTEASPNMGQQASPAGSAARLSVAGIPKSSSAKSLNRTSSLIASKDAE